MTQANHYDISIQRLITTTCPKPLSFQRWAKAALNEKISAAEITIRIVDPMEMTQLNFQYRHKNKPTNVLSFPLELTDDFVMGDIVICAAVVEDEAATQNKPVSAHWAHMVVHGILHLLGYDHEKNKDAELMEAEEMIILKSLGFNNPYEDKQ